MNRQNRIPSRIKAYTIGTVILAEGIFAADLIGIVLLGVLWRNILVDAMFAEGAVLLAAGGLLDVSRSITAARIRGFLGYRPEDPPPAVKGPGIGYVLLAAGFLLCLQAILILFAFPSLGIPDKP
ncbi:MAG: hypothetical protein C4530_10585 [Desulfobacteraceae bacterium]|nr:MAG: hypothetical protein C4530_10585 [Desulfobacteraceae bacterium]